MPHRLLLPLLLATTFGLAACQDVLTTAGVPCATLAVGDQGIRRAAVDGQVRAPRALVPNPPDSPVTTPLDEAPVPAAEVQLTDALGSRVPGIDTATTDGQGNYQIPRVPSGYTFQVVARFKTTGGAEATLRTLVRTTDGGVKADLFTATTLVTSDLARAMDGFTSHLDATTFSQAVELTGKQLNDGNAPDLTQPDKVQALIATLLNHSPALTTPMNQLKQDLATRPAGVGQ